jgi:hypothetical protein
VSSIIENALFQDRVTLDGQSRIAEIAAHFRLGDLLHLGSKKPIDVATLSCGIQAAREFMNNQNAPIFVCSDSVEIALSDLIRHSPYKKFIPVHLAPRETIYFLTQVSCFVGTPSKISEWVAVFRLNSGRGLVSFLPRQMKSQVNRIVGEASLIHYY